MRKTIGRSILTAVLVAACASPEVTPTPPPVAPGPASTPSASSQAPSPAPSTPSSAEPSSDPGRPPSAALPIRGDVRALGDRLPLIAPRPGGDLYVTIPDPAGSVSVALLDEAGEVQSGWPVTIAGPTACGFLLPAADGSVRVVCMPEDLNQDLNVGMRAFAFDAQGAALGGWPVDVFGASGAARMIGEDLTLFPVSPLGDVEVEGQPIAQGSIVSIARDGKVLTGAAVPMDQTCCGDRLGIDANGDAYGVWTVDESDVSRISSAGAAGVRVGWPVNVNGRASGPAFQADGRTLVFVGTASRKTSRVLAYGPGGKAVAARSPRLPITTVQPPDTGGCTASVPRSPVVAPDGTVFLYSEAAAPVFSLDPALATKRGWPYTPAEPLIRPAPGFETEQEAGFCPTPAIPAIGPDGTLYLLLEPRTKAVGGSVVAVGPNGRVRRGWPVVLRTAGSEFWSVVVGIDGTVFALAVEPEAGGTKSASVLAIAPDSLVRYTTTIIDP